MNVELTGKPHLGSMTLSRGGVYREYYPAPWGAQFAADVTGKIVVTDRAGALLAEYDGEPNAELNKVIWLLPPALHEDIPAGANFEMYITYDDNTYMVRYGRVGRREAAFPGAPINSTVYNAALYTDNVGTRSSLGPFWVQKYGKTVMHDNTSGSKPYGMGNDFILWDKSATHWYAPLRSDTVKCTVQLMKPPLFGGGSITVVLCSNYTMTNWIGVKFDTSANTVRPVTGSTAGPTSVINQGSTTAETVSTTPETFTIFYDSIANTIACYPGTSTTTPIFTWTDVTNACLHGEGHRYAGLIYIGGLLSVGPQCTYWSAKDDL